MKHIVGLRRPVYHEMPLHLLHPLLHPQIPLIRNRFQYLLNFRYLVRSDIYGKLAPIKNFTKRQHIVIADDYRHTPSSDCFHYSGAGNFPSTWTQAKLAVNHWFSVVSIAGKVLVHLDFVIIFFPGPEQEGSHVAGFTAGEEGEDVTLVRGFVEVRWAELAFGYVDFWQRDVSDGLEPFGGVGIAKDSDEMLVEVRGYNRNLWCLRFQDIWLISKTTLIIETSNDWILSFRGRGPPNRKCFSLLLLNFTDMAANVWELGIFRFRKTLRFAGEFISK